MNEPSPFRLPLALDSFVGRDAEMAELVGVLSGCRVVTVTGPAGVGKTRLALEVATAVASGFADGAVFVALAGAADAGLVAAAVAAALSLTEQPGRSLADTVVDFLRTRQLLVVVDNCEHVSAGVAAVVEAVLGACGAVTVLATSQEPLAVAGERVWALAPLGVPDATTGEVVELGACPAVRLFCERAGAANPGFELSAANAPAVAEICRRLDGVALAIELAAARVAVLSPTEIAARLADRFALLTGGRRAALGRHRSLAAALDWSHDLCSPAERALLRRLSVFAGGASLEALAQVCGFGDLGPAQVVGTLAGLVAKSLVVADTTGPQGRYTMLETVGHYAAARLSHAGEDAVVGTRHARWFTQVAEQAEAQLSGPDQQGWLAALEGEGDNLRAALRWAVATGQAVLALRLAGALTLFWRVRGSFSEGRAYLEEALDLAGPAGVNDVEVGVEVDVEVRAKASWGAGLLAVMVGDTPAALARLQDSLDIYRELGHASGWARCLLMMANCHVFATPLVAQSLLDQAVALARQAGDDWCLAHALALGGLAHIHQNEPDAARRLLDEAVEVAGLGGDSQGLRIALALQGELALGQGDYDRAQAVLDQTGALTRALGETYGTAVALIGLGQVALATGDYQRSAALLGDGVAAARLSANPLLIIRALHLQGDLAQAQERPAAARRHYHEAISVGTAIGQDFADGWRSLGEVAAAGGDPERAGELLDRALALARATQDHRETAAVLYDLAELARRQGDYERAVALHHQALGVRRRLGDRHALVESLEALAGLAATSGRRRGPYAARLLGAAESQRAAHRYARTPAQRRAHHADLAALTERLAPDQLRTAMAEGAKLSIDEAAAYATKGRGAQARPRRGWTSLTKPERDVATLAAAGLSNAEIGKELFIATWTVKGHLTNVYTKLGIASRVDLARMCPPDPPAPD